MAVKQWWESFSASDCLAIGSWEDMIDYIQHSACTDFTIYSSCTTGDQAFNFTCLGTLSTMTGGNDTGDDLKITANDYDDCSFIELYGDAGVTIGIEQTSVFEISTCSDETLFEIDCTTPSHKYIDFHCLDAHNFVLELRTSNPSSPTCLGQIWFRTDLV